MFISGGYRGRWITGGANAKYSGQHLFFLIVRRFYQSFKEGFPDHGVFLV